ncbi:ABC transporter ATP-binding protein [Agaribacter marinus]|uniref:ABC cobalamin uptake system ATPase BtuD n=1 Tax=Agaribacter marinus TaxID=1431249 RepID=A0AA37T0U2_9ALTE|nr:ABC transporter ATP-binding protein [Agaribacter marinus]GLR71606.1 ABC cobalamin uptake system ATPase BtuD [Agaribacter marinus]
MANAPALKASNISVKIDNKPILNGISLGLPAGKLYGVLGPNGAGKTTLLKCLSAQLNGKGEVLWQGQDITTLDIKSLAQQVAVVNQINDTVFALTSQQVIEMGLLPHKTLLARRNDEDEKAIQNALNAVGLVDKRQQLFSALSGGEQQRCLIARALVQRSPLLILDEPVNHLDVYYQHQILQLLKALCRSQNKTIVVSLHDLTLAASYCDELGLLSQGNLVATGLPKDVLQATLLTKTFNVPCEVKHSQDGYLQVNFRPEFNAQRSFFQGSTCA